MDETVYELLVPVDDAGSKNLTKALAVLSEFASRVRISDADVNDERGAVLEEMRMGRDARGRASEAYWKLLMKDSLYAERLPIGLESVIKKGNPAVFRRFYEKWYRPGAHGGDRGGRLSRPRRGRSRNRGGVRGARPRPASRR